MRGLSLATWITLAASALAPFFFSACGGGGGVSENHSNRGLVPGVGPFDKRGNYVEAWADDKSKGVAWRADRVAGAPDEPKKEVAKTKTTPPPKIKTPAPVVASYKTPPRNTRRETATYQRIRSNSPAVASTVAPRKPSATRRPTTVAQTKPSPPKPKAVKVKPKHKSPIRYTIKKGDTLYGLSRKYKTSVSAIQRANGLKGTNLRIGRKLLIPRY